MADNPYRLDPFTRVISVQFGAPWLLVQGLMDSDNLPFGVEFDFISMAGGTPGYQFLSGTPPGPGFTSEPFTITSPMLTRRAPTGAGAPLIGFGTIPTNPNPPWSLSRFILASTLPQQCRIRTRLLLPAGQADTKISYYKHSIKAGVKLDLFDVGPTPDSSASGFLITPSPVTQDFLFDQAKGLVTGPL